MTAALDFLRRFAPQLAPAERRAVIAELSETSSPGFDFFLLVVLSCSIATLGLVTNSPAVIIGAMLVAPLMSPIVGIGLASITGDASLWRAATSSLLRGGALAILLALAMTFLNRFLPFVSLQELPAEILSRTHPSPIDLLIAFSGGLAASYALTRPNLSAALPGVAIATALMPPLCTIGVGIALGRWDVAGGAALLFLTNAVTISFASAVVFFVRGFALDVRRAGQTLPRSLVLAFMLTFALLIPLTYFSVQFFQEAAYNRQVNEVVAREFANYPQTQIMDLKISHRGDLLDIAVTVRTSAGLRYEQVAALQKEIARELQQTVSFKVSQIFSEELDPLIPPTPTFTPTITQTFTPGASPTPTVTATFTPSLTATVTPTSSPTQTPTASHTPALIRAVQTGFPALQLYQSPGGPVISRIASRQQLTLLYGRIEYQGLIWVEVRDEEGRIGWIPEIYGFIITATPVP
ncbi:MAG: DUF389 domain-containing protein [Anaerolineales bacterium]|jgi:uncharacterized hydrophobic protein (TIGR00271 family)|nr:DUF389 domain-containing protein [Anaerolineales bacterium]